MGVLLVLCFLAGFSILTQTRTVASSQRADNAHALSTVYQDARYWVGQEQSIEHSRVGLSPSVLGARDSAEDNVSADLQRMLRADPSATTRSVVRQLESLAAAYDLAGGRLAKRVQAGDRVAAARFVQAVVDPLFSQMQAIVYRNAGIASRQARAQSATLRASQASATTALVIAFGLGVTLVLGFGLVIAQFRRQFDAATQAQVNRLAEAAITDPLTGLRNHRAFHEQLKRSLGQGSRPGAPVSLIMLDMDNLKAVNDNLGHHEGDERLKRLADAIRVAGRGTEGAYRVGGDEFAVVLEGIHAWNALEFTQRVNANLAADTSNAPVRVSAGLSEVLTGSDKDRLIREAGLALVAAKRSGHAAAIYTPEMEPQVAGVQAADARHTRTLASALALAVDAKDSYTRSHSQTVSELSAVIATELGFAPAHIEKMRIAGLLHDVGKIGIPDAVLNKPAKLTEVEYELMKTHAVLGYNIVLAADMPVEATWIRHHHSRWDGLGYPDKISGEDIPLESRIIFVADAFEAMTSDRPYRKAPGQQFAIDELQRNAGTQFDPRVVGAICRMLDRPAEPESTEPTPQRDRHVALV
ncbi:MAG: HD domain-containing phosphohydrolase [Solirubrobacteraceae bacterium]